MNKLTTHWFSYGLICVWLAGFMVCRKADLVTGYANKGMAVLGGEYYRFATALFLHSNFLHMLANAVTLYFVGKYLEPQINPAKLAVFAFLIGVTTEAVFASVFRDSQSVGGSPIVFSLIGLIAALQIRGAAANPFRLGTWYGNWILGYAVLANIPLFSTSLASTLMMHGLPLGLGVLLGCLGIGLGML